MRRGQWTRRAVRAAVLLGSAGLLPISVCNGTLGREFRSAAGSNIQQGLQSIVSGVLDGAFAVLEPNPTSDTSAR